MVLSLLMAMALTGQEERLIDFELKDQFDDTYRRADFLGKPLVIIGSARKGREFNPLWAQAFHDSLQPLGLVDSLHFFSVADLRGVPFFMRGMIKSFFPDDRRVRIAMDWKGTLAEGLRFNKETSNILIFDENGLLQHREVVKEVNSVQLDSLLTTLKRLLIPPASE